MGFIDSYKHLEKLCGEILNDDRKLSAYIDEMLNIPQGAHYVVGWDSDLKQLKRYRWIRNKIVHEPGCTEENMCEYGDTLWLENFYSRMMSATDPLSLYHKKKRTQYASQTVYTPTAIGVSQQQPQQNTERKTGCFATLLCVLGIIGILMLLCECYPF